MSKSPVIRAIFLAFLVAAGSGSALADRVTLETFQQWEHLGNPFLGDLSPQISPDGQRLLYPKPRTDWMTNSHHSEIWIIDADGSNNRKLAEANHGRWSPDGSRIAFIASAGGAPQIFVVPADGPGAPVAITQPGHLPTGFTWSPDGLSIAFSGFVAAESAWPLDLPKPEGADWGAEPVVITTDHYRLDGVGYLQGHVHVFVIAATGGEARQLTDGERNHSGTVWTTDGKEILFSAFREDGVEPTLLQSRVYAVDVASGAIRQLSRSPSVAGSGGAIAVSPDGQWVAYVGGEENDDAYTPSDIYVSSLDGSQAQNLTMNLDRSPSLVDWDELSGSVYVNVQSEGYTALYRARLDGGVDQITGNGQSIVTATMTAQGQATGIAYADHAPAQLVTFDVDHPEPKVIYTANADLLAGLELGDTEEIWTESSDGFRVQGWILRPPGFDPSKKYPMTLSIHGGPHAMFSRVSPYMWLEWQYQAAQDHIVVWSNPRGSTGYGKKFGNAIKHSYPGKDLDDLMAITDAVLETGNVDEDKMFVYGCSGGGVLTAWVVTHTNRFAAASSECTIVEWLTVMATADLPEFRRLFTFTKEPWEDPQQYLDRSPLMYVANVTTPTLLFTGDADLRTPISQAEQFYRALRVLGVDTAMIRLPNEPHGYFRVPANWIRAIKYRQEWFDRYKK